MPPVRLNNWASELFLRTGLVLDNGGGLINRMLPAFRMGLGGQIGKRTAMDVLDTSPGLAVHS